MRVYSTIRVEPYDRKCAANGCEDLSRKNHSKQRKDSTAYCGGHQYTRGLVEADHAPQRRRQFHIARAHGANHIKKEEYPSEHKSTRDRREQSSPAKECTLQDH